MVAYTNSCHTNVVKCFNNIYFEQCSGSVHLYDILILKASENGFNLHFHVVEHKSPGLVGLLGIFSITLSF